MATVYYRIVKLNQYLSDVETQLNTYGTSGYELAGIYNDQAVLISGSSGINVTGSVVLPSGVVSSSAQILSALVTSNVTASAFWATSNGNGTNFKVGDDVWIGDVNASNTMQVTGLQNSDRGYIRFGDNSKTQQIGSDGTNLTITTATGSINLQAGNIINIYSPVYSNSSITASYFKGDGSQLTNLTLPPSQIFTGSYTGSFVGGVSASTGGYNYNGHSLFNFGQFYDTTIQSGSASTAYAMKFNTTDIASGISIVSSSRITVANTGIYNLQFSAQLNNTANTNIIFDIWFGVDGSPLSNSNTQVEIDKQPGTFGRNVASWNVVLPMTASQYAEIYWSCNAATGQLFYSGSVSNPTRPAIPSVIATMTQIA
jgi:hypothetical protein